MFAVSGVFRVFRGRPGRWWDVFSVDDYADDYDGRFVWGEALPAREQGAGSAVTFNFQPSTLNAVQVVEIVELLESAEYAESTEDAWHG